MTSAVTAKVLAYFDLNAAGTEATIADVQSLRRTEVFLALTVLLDTGKVELYQNQVGDEMYRLAPKVHLEQSRKKVCESPSWDKPAHLEKVWARNAAVDTTALEEENSVIEAPSEGEPLAKPQPAKKAASRPKRITPFTPMSWEEKSSDEDEYTRNYYESL